MSTAPLAPRVALEFCKLCSWVHEVWLHHRQLFDCNPHAAALKQSQAAEELIRLNVISQEYTLLQIAKLHDPAVVARNNITLGIDYVVTYGAWSPETRARPETLHDKLEDFGAKLLSVRNKSLSHNDLAQILVGATLGAFDDGKDDLYFATLQELVDIVHDEAVGGPWPFDDLVKNDIAAFMAALRLTPS